MSKKNIILVSLIIVLGGAAAVIGYRQWQDHRQEAEAEYRRELQQFGRVEMGAPTISPRHFARHGDTAIGDLLEILESPEANDLAQQQALEAIFHIRGSDAAPLLIEQVERRKSPALEHAIALLGRTESRQAADFLAELVEREGMAVPALRSLSQLSDHARAHQDRILPLLDHSNRETAAQAALTLGSIGTEEAHEALIRRLDQPGLAQPAARGLARMQDDRGIGLLLEIVRRDREGDVADAEAGLTEAGTAAEPNVEELLEAEDPAVVVSALRILKEIGREENHQSWLRHLDSPERDVRLAVLELFDARNIPPAARRVFEFLVSERDNLSETEIALAERITRSASREDFDFYAEKLSAGIVGEKVAAIRAIAYSQNPRAVDLLVTGLTDAEAAIRRESAMSLGRMHGVGGLGDQRERVYDRISEMAENDPDPQVRSVARSLLIVLRKE